MLRETSYADLTVRAVAKRAHVAPATAYTYFSSKNHLIAEGYLDLVKQVPFFTDVNDSQFDRVDNALRSLALVVADDPEVAAACTTALLSGGDPAVLRGSRPDRRRDPSPHHLGHRARRRPTRRVRAGDDLLRRAGPGRQRRVHLPPDHRPADVRGQPDPAARRRPMTVETDEPLLDPYDYDFHEDPYPYYKRLRDEAPLYHNEDLGFWALSRHADVVQGFRNSTSLSNQHGVSLDPVSRGPTRAQGDVVPRPRRSRPPSAAHIGLKGLHAHGESATWRAASPRSQYSTSMPAALQSVTSSTLSTTSQASCRWTSSPN